MDYSKMMVGAKVTSDKVFSETKVIRKITFIAKSEKTGSGYIASADGGEPCPHCNHPMGKPIENVDAAWFNIVENIN